MVLTAGSAKSVINTGALTLRVIISSMTGVSIELVGELYVAFCVNGRICKRNIKLSVTSARRSRLNVKTNWIKQENSHAGT